MNKDNSLIELRKQNIIHIVQDYYNKSNVNNMSLQTLTNNALRIFLHSKYSIDEIRSLINKNLLLDDRIIQYLNKNSNNSYNIKNSKNGNLILKIIPMLNQEGIDFQLIGQSIVSIKLNNFNELDNYILELHINERDISKFNKVCTNLGLLFQDMRMHSSNILSRDGFIYGDIIVSNNSNELIKVFCFQRLIDGTIIDKRYYHDSSNRSRCRERIVGSYLASMVFGKEKINFYNLPIPIVSLEYTYLISKRDEYDNCKYLDGKTNLLDNNKLNIIREYFKSQIYVQNVPVTTLPKVSNINTKAIENDNALVSQMIVDAQNEVVSKNIDIDNNNVIRENVVVVDSNDELSNNNNNNDDNFEVNSNIEKKDNSKNKLDKYSIIIIILVLIAVILVGFIIYTWYFS